MLTAGASIPFGLGNATGHHGVIIQNMMLITLFLFIEARRYRYYELFASRVRLRETDFFAAMFGPPFGPPADWAESMAENLLHPHFTISTWEAVGRRFRRNYLWIYVVLAIAWVAKSSLFPTPLTSWDEFVARSAIGPLLSGGPVIIVCFTFLILFFVMGIATIRLQHASGEVLLRYDDSSLAYTCRRCLQQTVRVRKPIGGRGTDRVLSAPSWWRWSSAASRVRNSARRSCRNYIAASPALKPRVCTPASRTRGGWWR